MGELHLDIKVDILRRTHGIEVEVGAQSATAAAVSSKICASSSKRPAPLAMATAF
jgi:elongation factor G